MLHLFRVANSIEYCVYKTAVAECEKLGFDAWHSLLYSGSFDFVDNPTLVFADITEYNFKKTAQVLSFKNVSNTNFILTEKTKLNNLKLDTTEIKSISGAYELSVSELLFNTPTLDTAKFSGVTFAAKNNIYTGEVKNGDDFTSWEFSNTVELTISDASVIESVAGKNQVIVDGKVLTFSAGCPIQIRTSASKVTLKGGISTLGTIKIMLMKKGNVVVIPDDSLKAVNKKVFSVELWYAKSTLELQGNISKYWKAVSISYDNIVYPVQRIVCLYNAADSECPTDRIYEVQQKISQAALKTEDVKDFESKTLYVTSDKMVANPKWFEKAVDLVILNKPITIEITEKGQQIDELDLSIPNLKLSFGQGLSVDVGTLILPEDFSQITGLFNVESLEYESSGKPATIDFTLLEGKVAPLVPDCEISLSLLSMDSIHFEDKNKIKFNGDITVVLHNTIPVVIEAETSDSYVMLSATKDVDAPTKLPTITIPASCVLLDDPTAKGVLAEIKNGIRYFESKLDKTTCLKYFSFNELLFHQIQSDICIHAAGKASECDTIGTAVSEDDVTYLGTLVQNCHYPHSVIVIHDITLTDSNIRDPFGNIYLDDMGVSSKVVPLVVKNNAKITIKGIKSIEEGSITMLAPVILSPDSSNTNKEVTLLSFNPALIGYNKDWSFVADDEVTFYATPDQKGTYEMKIKSGKETITIEGHLANKADDTRRHTFSIDNPNSMTIGNTVVKFGANQLKYIDAKLKTDYPAVLKINQVGCSSQNTLLQIPNSLDVWFADGFSKKVNAPFVKAGASNKLYAGDTDLTFMNEQSQINAERAEAYVAKSPNENDHLPGWAIALIVIGCVIVVAAIVVAVLIFTKKIHCRKGVSVSTTV